MPFLKERVAGTQHTGKVSDSQMHENCCEYVARQAGQQRKWLSCIGSFGVIHWVDGYFLREELVCKAAAARRGTAVRKERSSFLHACNNTTTTTTAICDRPPVSTASWRTPPVHLAPKRVRARRRPPPAYTSPAVRAGAHRRLRGQTLDERANKKHDKK